MSTVSSTMMDSMDSMFELDLIEFSDPLETTAFDCWAVSWLNENKRQGLARSIRGMGHLADLAANAVLEVLLQFKQGWINCVLVLRLLRWLDERQFTQNIFRCNSRTLQFTP